MTIIIGILVFAYCMAAGLYTGRVAESKGYDHLSWFFGGFFFNFLALIAAAGLKPKD